MIIESLLAALSSGGLGAIVGGVGGIAEKVWSKKLDTELKMKEWTHIERMHELQMKADAQESAHELLITNAKGDWNALGKSIEADSSIQGTSQWVNNFRALIRPSLTVLVLLMAYVNPQFMNLATLSLAWWFGSRGSAEGNR